jgi:hypothetical protein
MPMGGNVGKLSLENPGNSSSLLPASDDLPQGILSRIIDRHTVIPIFNIYIVFFSFWYQFQQKPDDQYPQ